MNCLSSIGNNQKVGGVALYIDQRYQCKIVNKMYFVLDTIMECITVQIEMEKSKNILISCIYRKPGSNIDMFNGKITEIFSNNNNKKMVFICGDFNIDLLNPQEHNKTTEFINLMYSIGLYPSITRPTRITINSATLIDNIFTNVIDYKVESGLIINDVSDHLPVFANMHIYTRTRKDNKIFTITRHRTPKNINKFKEDLMKQDWGKVYVDNVNEASL